MERFIIQPSEHQQGWWVCSDTVHNIVCRFKENEFNDTQEFTLLDGDTFDTKEEALAYSSFIREMGDWLRDNHYDKIS